MADRTARTTAMVSTVSFFANVISFCMMKKTSVSLNSTIIRLTTKEDNADIHQQEINNYIFGREHMTYEDQRILSDRRKKKPVRRDL